MKYQIKLTIALIFVFSIVKCQKEDNQTTDNNFTKIDTIFSQIYSGNYLKDNLGTYTVEIENNFFTLTTERAESGNYYYSVIVSDSLGNERTRYALSNVHDTWVAKCLIKTKDNNLLMIGGIHDDVYDQCIQMLKISPLGQIIFKKIFSHKIDNYICGQTGIYVTESSNGEIAITGQRMMGLEYSGGNDVFFIKTDNLGNELINKTFSSSNMYDYAYEIKATSDNGYIILCRIDDQICLLKLDSDGNEIIKKSYGGNFGAYRFCATNDNGYLILGSKGSLSESDIYLIKIDMNYNMEYSKTIDLNSFDQGKAIMQFGDYNNIYIVGKIGYSLNNSKSLLIKLDSKCNFIWAETFGNYSNNMDCAFSIIPHTNGFILSGTTYSAPNNLGVYLNKIKMTTISI